jgi:hypothetical protein
VLLDGPMRDIQLSSMEFVAPTRGTPVHTDAAHRLCPRGQARPRARRHPGERTRHSGGACACDLPCPIERAGIGLPRGEAVKSGPGELVLRIAPAAVEAVHHPRRIGRTPHGSRRDDLGVDPVQRGEVLDSVVERAVTRQRAYP